MNMLKGVAGGVFDHLSVEASVKDCTNFWKKMTKVKVIQLGKEAYMQTIHMKV